MNDLLNKLPDLKQNIGLTKNSLNLFYKHLEDGKDKLNKNNNNYLHTPIFFLEKYPEILKIPPSNFIDPEFYNFLDESQGFYQKINLTVKDREFTIHLYLPSNELCEKDNPPSISFQQYINKIFLWLNFIVPYIKGHCSKKSTFYLLLTDFKKELPSHKDIITYKHVNSAFTTSCNPDTEIYIFRHEEWFKVLLHECFHCFGLDFSHYNNYEVENKIVNTFKVLNKNGIRVYEAYVEIWAEVLNVVFISYLETNEKKDYLILFDKLINNEFSFSAFQCIKLLNHLNFSYNDLLDSSCKTIRYEEITNVTSYYFIKFVLFLNLKKFESWCKRNNISLFKFNKKNMLKFVDFIDTNSKSESLEKCLQRMNVFFSRAKLSNFSRNTMRMTLIE